jgi:hypothetical protein
MRHEHVNRAAEIESVVKHYFEQVRIRRFPTLARQLSLYTFLRCHLPRATQRGPSAHADTATAPRAAP